MYQCRFSLVELCLQPFVVAKCLLQSHFSHVKKLIILVSGYASQHIVSWSPSLEIWRLQQEWHLM